MLPEVASNPHPGEDLSHQLCVGPRHDSVRSGDDESFEAARVELKSLQDGLRAVPAVDVPPEVPFSQRRIRVVPGKLRVVRRIHDVGKAKRDDLERWVPAHNLDRHLLFEVFNQRVDTFRTSGVLLVNRDVWRRHIEGQTERCLTRCVHDVPDARPTSGLEHVERAEHVVVEGGDITDDARSGNRGKVDKPVERRVRGLLGPRRGIILTEERVNRLAVVRQIDPQETRTTRPGRVKGDNLMSSLAERRHHAAPELARPTSYGDPHCWLLSRLPQHSLPPLAGPTVRAARHLCSRQASMAEPRHLCTPTDRRSSMTIITTMVIALPV